MASSVFVRYMNTHSVELDGKEIVFPYRKAEGLFLYLCLEKRISRDEAVAVFWSECSENTARKNLRDALYHIKKAFEPVEVIHLSKNSIITLNEDLDITADLDHLDENYTENYSGEFLPHFYIKNCLEFDHWVEEKRRHLSDRFVTEAKAAYEEAIKENRLNDACRLAFRLLDNGCADESFYRQAMHCLIQNNEYSRAIDLYQKLRDLLRHTLDEKPEAETDAMIENVMALRRRLSAAHNKAQDAFTGRKSELYNIFEFLEKPTPGKEKGRFILISGEAGIGKTSLMEKIRSSLDDEVFLCFSYACSQSESSLYLKAWNDLLSQMTSYVPRDSGSLPPQNNRTEEIADFRLFLTQYRNLLENTILAFSKAHPGKRLIFMIDDIHWMDAPDITLMDDIIYHGSDSPITIIAATRPDRRDDLAALKTSLLKNSMLLEINLERFSKAETREMVQALYPSLLKREDAFDRIYDYTQGNPLFLTELMKTLREGGEHLLEKSPVTSRISAIIQSRLINLSKEELLLLDILSVFYRAASVERLRLLYPGTDTEIYILLENLLQHRIINEERIGDRIVYCFTHKLIQNHIRNRISDGRYTYYIQTLASLFEEEYLATGNINLIPALTFYFGQMDDTFKTYTYQLEYYNRFFTGKQELYPALSAKVSNEFLGPEVEAGENVLLPLVEEIRALPQDNPQYLALRMKAEYLIGRYDLSSGDYAKGLRNMNTCIEEALALNDYRYLMDSYRQMIYYAIQVHDLPLMKKYISLCKDLLQQHEHPQLDALAVDRLHALYHIKNKRYPTAEKLLRSTITKLKALDCNAPAVMSSLTACYNYLGEMDMEREAWEDALKQVNKAIDCSKGEPLSAGIGMAYTNKGIILYRMNCYDKASKYFAQASECFRHVSIKWGKSKEETYYAFLDMQMGRNQSALNHYNAACHNLKKDYTPNTVTMLQELYNRLKDIDGLDVKEPPLVPYVLH